MMRGRLAAFQQELQQLGWTDGRNVQIDYRFGGGDAANIRKQAAELAALAPDVILAIGFAATERLIQATSHRADRVCDRSRSSRFHPTET